MLLEREYIHVDQPLDGMLEVGFPAETEEDGNLGPGRARDPESSDDEEDPPRFAPAQAGFLGFTFYRGSPSWVRLAISCPSRRVCEPFDRTGSASSPRSGTSAPFRGRRHHRARGGGGLPRPRHPSVIGPARPQ
jgi:hypothetical protein